MDVKEGSPITAGTWVIDTLQLFFQREALQRSQKGVMVSRPNIEQQTRLDCTAFRWPKGTKGTDKTASSNAGVASKSDLDKLDTAIASIQSQINVPNW